MVWAGLPIPDCRQCAISSCSGYQISANTEKKAVFDQKLMVGWGLEKVVLDESGFSAYRVGADRGLNFLSVRAIMSVPSTDGTSHWRIGNADVENSRDG